MSLRIHFLGQFNLQAGDLPLDLTSRPAQSLLAYLALNAGISQRREKLASLLWPDATESNGRSYLRQALWRIRKAMSAGSLEWQEYLQVSDITVTFDQQANYWLDTAVLLRPVESLPVEEIMATIQLYRGELLPGFYDEWVVLERDRLQAAYQQKMNLLLERLVAAGRWDDVVNWSEQWIRLDHAPEPAYRALLRAHAGLGSQGMVSATYQRCLESLERELGVAPSPETQRLYEQIRRQELGGVDLSPVTAPPARLPLFLDGDEAPTADKPIFVAREHELARLEHFLGRALSSQGQVIFVTGEAGGGKTALLQEFSRRAQSEYAQLIVAGGNCNAHTGIGDPYLPFREILELLSGDVEARWAAGDIDRDHALRLWHTLPLTGQALVENGPDLVDTFIPGPALAERAAASASGTENWLSRLQELVERQAANPATQGAQQDDLFEQVTRVLQALARQVPLVLLLDDLQWADLGSISLLFHLGRHLRGSRILIAGAYRPEEVALGHDGAQHPLEVVVNELQRDFGDSSVNMDRAESRAFVEAILDSESNRLGLPFREMLYRQTHGNPLFTVELLRGMQARGDLVQDEDGRWIERPQLAWEMLPARVEAVIAQRIGRLDQELQTLLRTASVEGERFNAEIVAGIRGMDEGAMLDCLSDELDRKHRLIRAQSITRRDGRLFSTYRFRHIQIQKYLYSSLDEVERVHLHERFGTLLEEQYRNQEASAAVAVRLARHFQEARITEKAMHYLFEAGNRALQLLAYEEAIKNLNKGLALLMTLPDSHERAQQELDVQLTMGIAWMSTGSPQAEMEKAYARARDLCRQVGKKKQLCSAVAGMALLHYVRARHLTARKYAEEALRIAQEIQDPLAVILGHWTLGFILFALGEHAEARKQTGQLLKIYDPDQHHDPLLLLRGVDAGVSAMAYDACCLYCLGYPEQAEKRRQEALSLARELDHPFTEADVLSYAGYIFDAIRGDAPSLMEYAEELFHLANEKGFPGWSRLTSCFRGAAMAMLGQEKEGIALLQTGIATRKKFNDQITLPTLYCTLARTYLKMGNQEEAWIAWTEAMTLLEEGDERLWETEVYLVQSELLLAQGDERNAEASLEKGLSAARRQQAKSFELRAATSLARLWQKQGKSDQARQMLEPIYNWFTEGLDTAELQEAQTLLVQLSS